LLNHFGSLERLRAADPEEIVKVPGVGSSLAKTIHDRLRSLEHNPPEEAPSP
jgi:excinuclease ABC subunit C